MTRLTSLIRCSTSKIEPFSQRVGVHRNRRRDSAPRTGRPLEPRHTGASMRLAPQSIPYTLGCVASTLARVGVPPLPGRDDWPQGQYPYATPQRPPARAPWSRPRRRPASRSAHRPRDVRSMAGVVLVGSPPRREVAGGSHRASGRPPGGRALSWRLASSGEVSPTVRRAVARAWPRYRASQ